MQRGSFRHLNHRWRPSRHQEHLQDKPDPLWGRQVPWHGLAGIAALLALLLLLAAPRPALARYAGIVIDAETGAILYEKHADRRLYPASLTKIMTLYMTFEALERGKLRLDQKLRVSRRAAGQTPSVLGLKRGERISVRDAILALITKSANDVATVLAEAQAKSELDFALAMTRKARELGMKRTRFRNATGLPNRRQYSTARDMARLARALIRDFPQYYKLFSTRRFTYKGRKFPNHNNLLASYKGADGIKTGYIRASGFNLVASAQRGGRRLIGVVFGGRTAKRRDAQMARLLDRGFQMLPRLGRGKALRMARKTIVLPRPLPRPASVTGQQQPRPARRVAALAISRPAQAPKPEITPTSLPAGNPVAWGIQIGAFRRLAAAQNRLYQAAAAAQGLLSNRNIAISKVSDDKDRAFYRARMIGLSENKAREACSKLRRNAIGCVVVRADEGAL